MFRAFFAEGAFASAFIPMFNRKVGESDGELAPGARFCRAARWRCCSSSSPVMTAVMLAAAWPLTWGLAGGFSQQHPTPDQFAFAVELSRITIPYLMLISLASLLGGILNSLDKFWVNAAAPILLNIAMVVGSALLPRHARGDRARTGDRGADRRAAPACSGCGVACRAAGRLAAPAPARGSIPRSSG